MIRIPRGLFAQNPLTIRFSFKPEKQVHQKRALLIGSVTNPVKKNETRKPEGIV